jgi:hypothetical protein
MVTTEVFLDQVTNEELVKIIDHMVEGEQFRFWTDVAHKHAAADYWFNVTLSSRGPHPLFFYEDLSNYKERSREYILGRLSELRNHKLDPEDYPDSFLREWDENTKKHPTCPCCEQKQYYVPTPGEANAVFVCLKCQKISRF